MRLSSKEKMKEESTSSKKRPAPAESSGRTAATEDKKAKIEQPAKPEKTGGKAKSTAGENVTTQGGLKLFLNRKKRM